MRYRISMPAALIAPAAGKQKTARHFKEAYAAEQLTMGTSYVFKLLHLLLFKMFIYA